MNLSRNAIICNMLKTLVGSWKEVVQEKNCDTVCERSYKSISGLLIPCLENTVNKDKFICVKWG